jgi:DNA repair protein REV1
MWENQDCAQTNGIDSVLSKAEIASCSYEARYVDIKCIVILNN